MLKYKIIGLALALVLIAGLVAVASGATGAYFSDTKDGTITGTIGSVKVDTTNMNISFVNLLPGEPQTVSVNFRSTGTGNQDIWVVFPNADALHALNDLGEYGQVRIAANGVDFFDAKNLNDGYPQGTPPSPPYQYPLYHVEREYKLVSSLAPGEVGSMSFTFAYSGKLTTQVPDGLTVGWNAYPVGTVDHFGLPYQIVATQVGQTP